MKKFYITLFVALFSCAMTVSAQEEPWADLYIPDVAVDKGATEATLLLCVKNNVAGVTGVTGFTATLSVPDGFAVTKALRGSRLKDQDDDEEYYFTYDKKFNDDGSGYVQAYTTKNTTLSGTDGDVIKFTVTIPSGAEGEYTMNLTGLEFANGSKVISTYTTATSKLTVGTTSIKEVNGDSDAAKSGKYLKDGKIVIMKNGKEFNASGAQMK